MAARPWTIRLESEVMKAYDDMAVAMEEGLRQLGVPVPPITGTSLMRENLEGGAATYRRILEKHKTPLEVVRALQGAEEARVS